MRASNAAASPRPAIAPAPRLLIEAAWCYRFPARVSRERRLWQEAQAQAAPRDRLESAAAIARATASSPAAASRPMSSPPRSPVSRRASSGPSPSACRRRWADRHQTRVIAGRRQQTIEHAAAGQGWRRGRGQENPRIHYLPGRRSDAGPETEAAPRRITGHAVPTRASEDDQPSS